MKTIKLVVVVVSASHKSYLNGFRNGYLSLFVSKLNSIVTFTFIFSWPFSIAVTKCSIKLSLFLLDNKKLHKKYLKRDLRHSKPEFEFHVFFLLFSRTTSTAVSKKSILCYPVTWNHFPMQNQITSPISRVPIPLQVQSNQLLQSRVLQHHHEHVLPHLHHSIDDDRPH